MNRGLKFGIRTFIFVSIFLYTLSFVSVVRADTSALLDFLYLSPTYTGGDHPNSEYPYKGIKVVPTQEYLFNTMTAAVYADNGSFPDSPPIQFCLYTLDENDSLDVLVECSTNSFTWGELGRGGRTDVTFTFNDYLLASSTPYAFVYGVDTFDPTAEDTSLGIMFRYPDYVPGNTSCVWRADKTALGCFTNQPAIFSIGYIDPVSESGSSSILFIPGLQGSVLKENDDTLWPPSIFSEDVARLALTENSESVNDIRVAGILNTFYGAQIYGGFSDFMDSLVATDVIEQWESFSYDWRLPLPQTLEAGVIREGETDPDMLVETVESLASSSRTGKVTIVAHSMGGILGKLLIQRLEQQGKADLVDTFIMVGTPQLGTPQAVASLLHGDQPFELKLFTKSSVVRSVGRNMESTHTLLPSREYFDVVTDPVISFNQASFTDEWRSAWGDTIDTFEEFSEFMTGQGVTRERPVETTLPRPEVLRTDVFNSAQAVHENIDTYSIPETIRVVQIAGWGLKTMKNIFYKNQHLIFQGYQTQFTTEGDGTVVYPSSLAMRDVDSYYINLFNFNDFNESKNSHADFIGSMPVLSLIKNIVEENGNDDIDYISATKPPLDEIDRELLISTHSPVLLGTQDNSGRFTGVRPENAISPDTYLVSEEIPGSSFLTYGGDQYMFLPDSGTYEFEFVGTDTGPVTIEVNSFKNDETQPLVTFSDFTVTADTQAHFTIQTEALEEVVVTLDVDGDGKIDTTVMPDGYETTPTLAELLESLKLQIMQGQIKEKLKMKLLQRVERLEKKIAKQKTHKASKIILHIENKIMNKVKKGKISEADVEVVLKLLNDIEQAL